MSFNEGRCWTTVTISERRIRHAWRRKHKGTKSPSPADVSTSWHAIAQTNTSLETPQLFWERLSCEEYLRCRRQFHSNEWETKHKQNKATVLWKNAVRSCAHTLSYIQILPHLSAEACQNCSLSLPLQDYRQSAPETKPTHGSSMRTRSLCTRATNKKRSDIHLDNLRGLTAFSQSWQPEEGGEESSLIKQGLGRQMEPLAGC